jgi:hypothetical protein
MEEAIAEGPLEPQTTSGQTTVPEQGVEGRSEPSTSAASTNPAEGNTSAPRVTEQTKEQQPEVIAQSMFVDATARGKAIVIAEAANSRPAPIPEEEAEEDKVEEVLGHPQDRRQYVYVSRWWNDQWVVHEEIPEVEETMKVEWAVKRLVTEVQVCFASPPDLAI